MSFWSIESIKSTLGASYLARAKSSAASGERVSIDSRALTPNCVFVAIKGDRTDGHQYLTQAVQGGASVLIVHDAQAAAAITNLPPHVHILQVPDTAAALLRLAAAYRRTLETTRVIAVGGSNGKTTTCRLMHSVLSASLRGSASPKSFNNSVGVPLTILAARPGDQYLICEVGTNAPGEIAPLAAVIEPDIAVITSIGREHLEGLGSIDGVIAEESALLMPLRRGGTAVLTADSPRLLETAKPLLTAAGPAKQQTLVTFGRASNADLRVGDIVADENGTSFSVNKRDQYRVPLPGPHNACNAAAVIAVARRLGMAHSAIAPALANAKGPEMRMQRSQLAGVSFINDAYNANPDSTLAAIETYATAFGMSKGVSRRVLVFGDMLELGEQGPDLHREIGEAVARAGCFDLVVLVGPLSMFAAERISKISPALQLLPFPSAAPENAAKIAAQLRAGDSVLLKGSRGTGLERIMDAFNSMQGAAADTIVEVRTGVGKPTPR